MKIRTRNEITCAILAIIGVATASIATLQDATNSTTPKKADPMLKITVEQKNIDVDDFGIKVQGIVKCLSRTGVVQYSSWIRTDYLKNTTGAEEELEETFSPDDKRFYEATAGTNGFLIASLGLAAMKDGTVMTWRGKGLILVYATYRGVNGLINRISNLVRIEVDFDNRKASILEDVP